MTRLRLVASARDQQVSGRLKDPNFDNLQPVLPVINFETIADCVAGSQVRGIHDMLAVDKRVITLYVRNDEAV